MLDDDLDDDDLVVFITPRAETLDGERRLAVEVLACALRDAQGALNAQARGQLLAFSESALARFWCLVADVDSDALTRELRRRLLG